MRVESLLLLSLIHIWICVYRFWFIQVRRINAVSPREIHKNLLYPFLFSLHILWEVNLYGSSFPLCVACSYGSYSSILSFLHYFLFLKIQCPEFAHNLISWIVSRSSFRFTMPDFIYSMVFSYRIHFWNPSVVLYTVNSFLLLL